MRIGIDIDNVILKTDEVLLEEFLKAPPVISIVKLLLLAIPIV